MYEYVVVHVQAGDTQANEPLMKRFGTKPEGYPYLTVLDASGKTVTHQETGSLEDGPKHDPAKVIAFLEKHQAPYLNAQEVFDAALARAKKEEKRLFLSFEAPW